MTIENKPGNKEDAFMQLGLDAFFNDESDKNIDWKEFFQLTEDENYYAVNNNQIIEDEIKENHIWKQ